MALIPKAEKTAGGFVRLSFANDKSGDEILSFGMSKQDAIDYATQILDAADVSMATLVLRGESSNVSGQIGFTRRSAQSIQVTGPTWETLLATGRFDVQFSPSPEWWSFPNPAYPRAALQAQLSVIEERWISCAVGPHNIGDALGEITALLDEWMNLGRLLRVS